MPIRRKQYGKHDRSLSRFLVLRSSVSARCLLANALAPCQCPDPLGREKLCPIVRFQPSDDINNLLAAKLETENDRACEDFLSEPSFCQPCQ
jgi:hypothetical protein